MIRSLESQLSCRSTSSTRSRASESIMAMVAQQEQTVSQMDTLIQHALRLAQARTNSRGCDKGVELSIKQIVKYSKQKVHAVSLIAALTELDLRVRWRGEMNIDYEAEMDMILAEPMPQLQRQDEQIIMQEARASLMAVRAC